MKEGVVPKEAQQNWVPMRDLLPVDYWVGFQYKGAYANRLEIDLQAIEQICRRGSLPPIIFRNDTWTPPVAMEPEMVAPGLSAFKKAAYQSKHPTIRGGEYIDRKPTEGEVFYNGQNISLGWEVRINDRKLLYDFEKSHPYATKAQIEVYFVNKINSLIKESLVIIAYDDFFVGRYRNKEHNVKELVGLLSPELTSILAGAFMPIHIENYFLRTLKTMAASSVFKNIFHAAYIAGIKKADHERGEDGLKTKHRVKKDQDRVSVWWRKTYFKDTYLVEPEMSLDSRKAALIALPGGSFLETIICTYDAALLQKKPIARMR